MTDGDTSCICSRCTMRRRKQDFRRNGCLKNGDLVPAFSNSGVYRFLERGTNVRFVPCRGDMSWEGGRFKSTPRAKLYQHPNVVAITKNSRSFSHGKEGNHTLLHYRHALINTLIFLAYLVPEDQSALQQVMGEEREANLWCLQLQRETEDGEETLKSLLQMLTELWVDS